MSQGSNNCLVAQDIMLQPPTGLTATASIRVSVSISLGGITVTNETGFIVQRRREGSGIFGFRAGRQQPIHEILFDWRVCFPEATYIFRVQAFNDDGIIPPSQMKSATTTLAGAMHS